jgi:hypothetical protein
VILHVKSVPMRTLRDEVITTLRNFLSLCDSDRSMHERGTVVRVVALRCAVKCREGPAGSRSFRHA